jgi:hypothetical protein
MVAFGIALLTVSSNVFVAGLFIIIFGISSKSLFVLSPLIVADSHGLHRFGIICATIGAISGLGGTASVSLIMQLTKREGGMPASLDPRVIFLMLAFLALLSAYCIYKAKPLNPNPEA